MVTQFRKLNGEWNAEPNAPEPTVHVVGNDVILEFFANALRFARFSVDQRLQLRFSNVRRYRLGLTNDEGWYMGQCRFSGMAPAWGAFYEVTGDLRLGLAPQDWREVAGEVATGRHFLFYLRDETFECEADD